MRRKQNKSLLWRRFGYVILVIIKFCELLLWISLTVIINALRSYIKHSEERFIRCPSHSKLVKKSQLHLVCSTHFLVFGYLMKHSSLCLIYYIRNSLKTNFSLCDWKGDFLGCRERVIMFLPHRFHQLNHWVLLCLF